MQRADIRTKAVQKIQVLMEESEIMIIIFYYPLKDLGKIWIMLIQVYNKINGLK